MVDKNKHSEHNVMLSPNFQADTFLPQPKQDSDVGLFLLEALVDKIRLYARLRYDEDYKTCVRLSLPDHPSVEPLVIREDEPVGSSAHADSQDSTKYFNVGKSVLFVLQKHEINTAMNKFNIETTVYDTPSSQPTKICNVFGQARINLTKEFVKARQKYLADPSCVSCEVLQDKFTLTGSDNSNTGEICMYLRISCFGKLIVTRFQGKGGQLTLGAGMSGPREPERPCSPNHPCECSLCTGPAHPVHSDASQASSPAGSFDERCYCSKQRSQNVVHRNIEGYCLQVPQVTPQRTLISDELTDTQKEHLSATCKKLVEPMYPETQFTVQNVSTDVKNPSKPNYNSMPCQKHKSPAPNKPHAHAEPSVACRNTEAYCLHVPQGRTKKYEEIGTTLTGNELKIKVPASSAIIKRISQTHCAIQRPYDKDNKRDGKDKPKAREPCNPPCGRNQISLALPCEETCCAGSPPADTQFTCTTEGCTQIGKHAAAAGFVRSDPKDPKPEKEIIPNKDVYVFKVAKTSLEGDRKCKLELEFTAPKAGPLLCELSSEEFTVKEEEQYATCKKLAKQCQESLCKIQNVYTSDKRNFCYSTTEAESCTNPSKIDIIQNTSTFYEKIPMFKSKPAVYMTYKNEYNLFNGSCSGTQATASINKHIQVRCEHRHLSYKLGNTSTHSENSGAVSNYSVAEDKYQVYFFGKKKGMGGASKNSVGFNAITGTKRKTANSGTDTDKCEGVKDTSSNTEKKVVIASPCPKPCVGPVCAVVSHIKIGPKECPHVCCAPTQSITFPTDNVQVRSCPNPRKGVFELVIRRMNGAPLSRNELMLEWTPPPCRAPVFANCTIPCPTSRCRIVCRPPKPRCVKKCSSKPCGPIPISSGISSSCGTCTSCCAPFTCKRCCVPLPPNCKLYCRKCDTRRCKMPCGSCGACATCGGGGCGSCSPPCDAPSCSSCPRVRCMSACRSCRIRCPPPRLKSIKKCPKCCSKPCKALPCCPPPPCQSPCSRTCPVGYRKRSCRKFVPISKPRKIHISPCMNRKKCCPVRRCCSVQPCVVPSPCCDSCPPRKCTSGCT